MYKRFLMAFLFVGLMGCAGKPGDADLAKSFNGSFEGFKQVGVDLSEYIEASSFDVADSYEDGKFYVVKATPSIRIKKDIDAAAVQSFEDKAGMMAIYVFQTINMLETLGKYDAGQIDQQQMMAGLRTAHMSKPEGILKSGDSFSGLESEYKFRKTDNGWMAVE